MDRSLYNAIYAFWFWFIVRLVLDITTNTKQKIQSGQSTTTDLHGSLLVYQTILARSYFGPFLLTSRTNQNKQNTES